MACVKKVLLAFLLVAPWAIFSSAQKKVAIIGTGYVGLISGAGLAEIGHRVICVDIDQEKVKNLSAGIMPIYEDGLAELVHKHSVTGNLAFTSDMQQALAASDIVIIAVGTPVGDNGAANMSAFQAVMRSLAHNSSGDKIVCVKSTVPVGTHEYARSVLHANRGDNAREGVSFAIISNPEFLREGCALKDFFGRNPIVLGGDNKEALRAVTELYQPLIDAGQPLIVTDAVTAETIKYAWNTYLKVRISFINDISRFCCAVGADIDGIKKGLVLSDQHLPTEKLSPGPGIGGSCFPKDATALISLSRQCGVQLPMIEATIAANKVQKNWIVDQVYELLGGVVAGKNVAILGAAFKANTDDIRYSCAIEALERLVPDGAQVRVYDPQAMKNLSRLFPGVTYCASLNDAVQDADVVLLLTEWDEFKRADIGKIAELMRNKNVVDARNLWDPGVLKQHGFVVRNLARKRSTAQQGCS